ncbi:MAG: hypothetical protein AB1544_14960 [Pseudomonadota bacterium]|jgi:hypothetical protein
MTGCSIDMRRPARWGLLALLALGTLGVPPLAAAGERAVFRSQMPDGRVVYADEPAAGAVRSARLLVEPHPGDPAQALAAQHALEATRARLQQQGQARALKLAELDRGIAFAQRELWVAQSAQTDGQTVVEGDRQGRRFAPSYWQRQQFLAQAVARARLQLDALRAERAALQ